jgi:tetratricopeptide (TPR) repeat protein
MRQSCIDARAISLCIAFFLIMLVAISGLSVVMLLILPETAVASQLNQQSQISPLKHLQKATSPIPLSSPTLTSNSNSNSDQNMQYQQAINIVNLFVVFAGVFVAVVAVILGALTLVATILGVLGFLQVPKIRRLLAEVEKSRDEVEKSRKEVEQFRVESKASRDEVEKMRSDIEIGFKRASELRVEFEAGNMRVNELLIESEVNHKRINELRTQFEADMNHISELVEGLERQLRKATQHTEDEIKHLDKRIESESQKFIEAAYYYSEGSKQYRSGDNEHAIEFYLRALKLEPNNFSILERIGRAYSNLGDSENAIKYLNKAFEIDPDNESVLRSLALEYRYTEPERGIGYLKRIVQKNPLAFEAWDFLGLFYRDQLVRGQVLIKDQSIIDQAIEAHEKALAINERPETLFYLAILLLYSPNGDKIRAKQLMSSAFKDLTLPEHDLRIRDVWKILISAGLPIVDGNKKKVLGILKSLVITNRRIYNGINTHLRFLLEGAGHSDWEPELMSAIKWKES